MENKVFWVVQTWTSHLHTQRTAAGFHGVEAVVFFPDS